MLLATRARRGRISTLPEPSSTDTPGTATVVSEASGVDPGPITMAVAGTYQLDVLGTDAGTGLPLTGFSESWLSSNPSVATVDSTGLVTGVASGTCTISCAISKNGASATDSLDSAITVSAPTVTQISRSPASISGLAGSAATITYQAQDAGGNAISGQTYTATSSNTGIATVVVSGNIATVTFVAAGTCTITGHVGAIDSPTTAITVSVVTGFNEPAGMTPLLTSDLASDTHNTGYGTTGLVRASFKAFTNGNNITTRKISTQANGAPDGWNSGTAFPSIPNGMDDVQVCQFGGGASIINGDKGLLEPLNFPTGVAKSQYWRFWSGVSWNWWGEDSGALKRLYFRCPSTFPAILKMDGAGSAAMQIRVTYQTPNLGAHALVQAMTRNTPYLIELHAVCATSSSATDGGIWVWINGVLKYFRTNMATGATTWSTPQFQTYYGGALGSTPPGGNGAQFTVNGDGIYVSTSSSRILVP